MGLMNFLDKAADFASKTAKYLSPIAEQLKAGYEEAQGMTDSQLFNYLKSEQKRSKEFIRSAEQRNHLNGVIKCAKERGIIKTKD